MPHKLGLIHVETPSDVAMLGRVMKPGLIAPPRTDWHTKYPADGDPLGNDQYGNCLPCAEMQAIYMRRANAWGDTTRATRGEAIALYSKLTGFDPTTGRPDDGTMVDAAMKSWSQHGIRLDSQNEDVPLWVSVQRRSIPQIKLAIWAFGPVQLSFAMPAAIEADPEAPWTLTRKGRGLDWSPGSWGGHRVTSGKYDETHIYIRTWGVDVPVDLDFFIHYCIACDATISREWCDTAGLAPSGMTFDEMRAEAGSLRGA